MFGWLFEMEISADVEILFLQGLKHTMPEECSCHSHNDGKAAEVESKARAGNNGEGHV